MSKSSYFYAASLLTGIALTTTVAFAQPPLDIKGLSANNMQVDSVSNRYKITVDCNKGSCTILKGPLPTYKDFNNTEKKEDKTVIYFDETSGQVKKVISDSNATMPTGLTFKKVCQENKPLPPKQVIKALSGITYEY